MKRLCLALILNAVCAAHACAAVAPGHLDPTFGDNGKRIVPANVDASSPVSSVTSVVAEDGSTYLLGTILYQGNTYQMTIARLDAAGDPDNTFGDQGVLTHLPQSLGGIIVNDATLDPEGRLLVAGEGLVDGKVNAIVCRFDAAGVPDAGFGTDGTPGCYAFPVHNGKAEALLVQHGTGRVILAVNLPSDGKTIGFVVGLQPDGSELDGSFGAAFGQQFIPETELHQYEFLDLAQDSAGELVATGYQKWGVDDHDVLAFRLDTDGKIADAFGLNGAARTSFDLGADSGNIDEVTSAVLTEDGRVVLAGFAQTGPVSYRPTIVRFLADGSLDGSFDYDENLEEAPGEIAFDLCNPVCDMRAHDLAVLPDGKIVLGGTIANGVEGDNGNTLPNKSNFFALRLMPSGQPDPSFRSPGSPHAGLSIVAFDQLPPQSLDAAFSVATHGDGLLLAGFAQTAAGTNDTLPVFDFAVARIGNRSPMFQNGFEDPLDP